MYLHIGGEYAIPEKTIIGVFDFDSNTLPGNRGSKFLMQAEKENRIEYISFDLPESIIVAIDRVYISPVSTDIIKSRMKKADEERKDND